MVEEFERVEEREEEEEVKDVCPLLSVAFRMLTPCLKEQCAWWGGKEYGCIVQALFEIASVADAIGTAADVLAAGD